MAIDPQSALNKLIYELEAFHNAVERSHDAESPAVLRAGERLADAYTVYDDVIFRRYGVEAPFDTLGEEDFLDDEDDSDFYDEDFDDLDDEYDDEDYDDEDLDEDFADTDID